MSTISDALILNEGIAYRRALAELYPRWLVKKNRTIEVPLDEDLAEGQVHEIDNPRESIVCTAVARSMTHVITPVSQMTRLTMETCNRFE